MKNRRSFLTAVASGSVGLSLVARDPAVAQVTPAPLMPTVVPAEGFNVEFGAGLTAEQRTAVAFATDANRKAALALNPRKTYTEFADTPELISCGNLAGLPALAMPNGVGDHGLPTSIALMGTAFNETRLTAIGKTYQSLTAFHTRRPPLVTQLRA